MPNQSEAALIFQKRWRGRQARKKYGIQQIPVDSLAFYPMFLIGNDPKITGFEAYATQKEKIAFIGTSGLRSLALSCELGNKEKPPKLIIVDTSMQVIAFWKAMRTWVEGSNFLDEKDFLLQYETCMLPIFKQLSLYRDIPDNALIEYNTPDVQYENQNPSLYMQQLVYKHGLPYILSIIKGMAIIGQSWTDKQFFSALKNIIALNGIEKIYAYPSNIEEFVAKNNPESGIQVGMNIQLLEPELAIATGCKKELVGIPTKVMLTPHKKHNALEQILKEFGKKIEHIGEHYPQAKEVATKLYTDLTNQLHTAFTDSNNEKLKQFARSAKETILAAVPVLQKDLDWGTYLLNFAKQLMNAIVCKVSFSSHQGLFAIKPSVAVETTTELSQTLQTETSPALS